MIETLLVLRRRWGLLAFTALANLVLSSLAATPWALAVKSGSLSAFHDPDAALFADGGMILVEWLRVDGPALLGALRAVLLLTSVSALVLLFPAALLVVGLADSERLSFARHGQRAVAALPRFLLLFGGTLLCQALLVLLCLVLGGAGMGALAPAYSPWLSLALALTLLLAWALPSLLQDLTRAVLVTSESRVPAALGRAIRILLSQPLRVLGSYLVPAALAWLVASVGLVLTAKLARQSHAEIAGWLNFVVHQASLCLLVALRAYWLVRALGFASSFASSSPPAPADTRAGSGEPDDPSLDRGA